MSDLTESGLSPAHLAVLQHDHEALAALLVDKKAARAKTSAMLTSWPRKRDNRVMRPASATFYPPDPTPEIGAERAFDKGSTPLHLAAAIGDVKAVELLLANKARPSKDGVGATPLHLAALGGHLQVVERLLASKVDLEAGTKTRKSIRFDAAGMTPLLAALESGDLGVVEVLLDRGATPHARTKSGFSAALFAARGGSVEALDRLVEAGVSVNEAPAYMNFPLQDAVERGHRDMVRRLLALGAPSETSSGNQAPLRAAIERNDLGMRQLLLDGGVRPLPDHGIEHAIRGNDVMYVTGFLDGGGDIDAGGTGAHLWLAAALGHLPLVDVLLSRGADVNASSGRGSALHVALGNRVDQRIVSRILEAEPDCSQVDDHGNNVLMSALNLAADDYHARIATMVRLGANPHSSNRSGRSPMSFARDLGDARVIAMFEAVAESGASDRSWSAVATSDVLEQGAAGRSWKAMHHALWDELVPPSGEAPTVQGELVRCIGRLTDEAYRNGNINWGEMHRGFVATLEDHLLDGTFGVERERRLAGLLKELRNHRSPDLSGDGSAHYLVNEAVVEWCTKHPELIPTHALGASST